MITFVTFILYNILYRRVLKIENECLAIKWRWIYILSNTSLHYRWLWHGINNINTSNTFLYASCILYGSVKQPPLRDYTMNNLSLVILGSGGGLAVSNLFSLILFCGSDAGSRSYIRLLDFHNFTVPGSFNLRRLLCVREQLPDL